MRRVLCAIFAATTAAASVTAGPDPALEDAIGRTLPAAVEARHHLHQNPELSNREFETSKYVAEHLRGLGLEVRTGVAHTGVVATLRGGRPGPTVAVRADMDALPVTEQTDLPFRSTVRAQYDGQEVGVAHACGHDVHTAVGLGVAAALASVREDLPGNVLFIFQPAEEGPPPGEEGGAKLMVEEGVLGAPGADSAPRVIFGLHSKPDFDVGRLGYAPGPALASVDRFRVSIRGRQAHGAAPHLSVDPVVMASEAVLALQTIRSRNLPPLEPSVVTVGIIRGGQRYNIIPGEVHIEGTVRAYSADVQDTIERRIAEIIGGITQAGGGSFEMHYDRITPATVNEPVLAEWGAATLGGVFGRSNVVRTDPVMGGEDFAYFAQVIPGFYFWLGTREPGGASGGLHTPDFRADDGAVRVGMTAMASLVVAYLEEHAPGAGGAP